MRCKHLTFGIVFLVLLCSFIALVAVSQQKSVTQLENEMEEAKDALYLEPHGAWPRYKAKFDFYEGKVQKFITEHGKLTGTKFSWVLDPASAAVEGLSKNITAYYLSQSLRDLLAEIDKAGAEASFFYVDEVLKAWYAYHDAVGAYNAAVSPVERINIQEPSEYAATPIFLCQGSCDARFETASLAQVEHQVYCPEKHGPSGTTGVTFYLCGGSCSRSAEHWLVCGGSCGEKFAPKRINRGQGNFSYVANSPHYVTCSESGCSREYYTCEHSTCPDSGTHSSSSSSSSSYDNTPDCSYCTDGCSSCPPVDNTPYCSYCTDGNGCWSCGSDDDDDDSSSDDDSEETTCSICNGADENVPCTKCGATYHICTSQVGDCSVAMDENEAIYGAYHYSDYSWQ